MFLSSASDCRTQKYVLLFTQALKVGNNFFFVRKHHIWYVKHQRKPMLYLFFTSNMMHVQPDGNQRWVQQQTVETEMCWVYADMLCHCLWLCSSLSCRDRRGVVLISSWPHAV